MPAVDTSKTSDGSDKIRSELGQETVPEGIKSRQRDMRILQSENERNYRKK